MKIRTFPTNKYKTYDIQIISCENYENHEHLIIQCENDMKKQKTVEFYCRITKIVKTQTIQCENHENHKIL